MLVTDTLTPRLAAAIRATEDPRPYLEAAGQYLANWGKRSFNTPALRPKPWPARKDKKPHPLLKLSGTLWRGTEALAATDTSVIISNPTNYAATHQYGRGPIPARPFLPWGDAGLAPDAQRLLLAMLEKMLMDALAD